MKLFVLTNGEYSEIENCAIFNEMPTDEQLLKINKYNSGYYKIEEFDLINIDGYIESLRIKRDKQIKVRRNQEIKDRVNRKEKLKKQLDEIDKEKNHWYPY